MVASIASQSKQEWHNFADKFMDVPKQNMAFKAQNNIGQQKDWEQGVWGLE